MIFPFRNSRPSKPSSGSPESRWLAWITENAAEDGEPLSELESETFKQVSRLSLFWRTFFLLALLLAGSITAWYLLGHRLPNSAWLGAGIVLSLAGVAWVAHLINRPFKRLSFATKRIGVGDFVSSRLNEDEPTAEIRLVNIGFNRMAQRLAKIDEERAVMLAGISHDLRTPLARLRLEMEMSVNDPVAQAHMVADLEQLDAIIDKFMDYARPGLIALKRVSLNDVIQSCLYAFEDRQDIEFRLDLPDNIRVLADAVELGRVISNLIENARRYGKTPETGVTELDITAQISGPWIQLQVRDHGAGVPPEHLPHLTKPFYRSDAARTAATGAGLGLAIVDKTVRRMGGSITLGNSNQGGFSVRIQLQLAD